MATALRTGRGAGRAEAAPAAASPRAAPERRSRSPWARTGCLRRRTRHRGARTRRATGMTGNAPRCRDTGRKASPRRMLHIAARTAHSTSRWARSRLGRRTHHRTPHPSHTRGAARSSTRASPGKHWRSPSRARRPLASAAFRSASPPPQTWRPARGSGAAPRGTRRASPVLLPSPCKTRRQRRPPLP
jgi:hypothetical protein